MMRKQKAEKLQKIVKGFAKSQKPDFNEDFFLTLESKFGFFV